MLTKFDVGVGVAWSVDDVLYRGVVIHSDENMFEVVPVQSLDDHVRCYDEGGAVYERDRDNVRLADCPPPFTLLCVSSDRNGCYAQAGADSRLRFSEDVLDLCDVCVLDDGAKISEGDMAAILDHPWREEKQVSRPLSALDRLRNMSIHGDEPDCEEPAAPDYF